MMKKRIIFIVTAVLAVALVATGIVWYDNTKITIEGYDEIEVTTFPLSKEGALMLGEKAIREEYGLSDKVALRPAIYGSKYIFAARDEGANWAVYFGLEDFLMERVPAVRIRKSDGAIVEFFRD